MYSDLFCRVYNVLGWNVYPEALGEKLLLWMQRRGLRPGRVLDLACGTGVLCDILRQHGMEAQGVDLSTGMITVARENFPEVAFHVGNMITFRPQAPCDLITCTGDALNHLGREADVKAMLENTFASLSPGGYFIFDLLDEGEISDSEPFEMDFTEHTRVWFQMTREGSRGVNLRIRVFEDGLPALEENIRETLYEPGWICRALEKTGFEVLRCHHSMLEEDTPGSTWFVIARRPANTKS